MRNLASSALSYPGCRPSNDLYAAIASLGRLSRRSASASKYRTRGASALLPAFWR